MLRRLIIQKVESLLFDGLTRFALASWSFFGLHCCFSDATCLLVLLVLIIFFKNNLWLVILLFKVLLIIIVIALTVSFARQCSKKIKSIFISRAECRPRHVMRQIGVKLAQMAHSHQLVDFLLLLPLR